MPLAPKKPCAICGQLSESSRCPAHTTKPVDRREPSSKRGYDGAWEKLREVVIKSEPLCRRCRAKGKLNLAEEVHHVIPIRERPDLRLVRSNLEPLCRPCHELTKYQ